MVVDEVSIAVVAVGATVMSAVTITGTDAALVDGTDAATDDAAVLALALTTAVSEAADDC